MMLLNQKKLVQVLKAKVKKKAGKPGFVQEIGELKMPDSPVQKDYEPGYEQAAHEMIQAIKADDAISLAYSLKNFVELCKMDDDEGYME